jgi:hypothetical protein
MSEIDYIGADELVFNNDIKEGIHSGGFDVKSIMMKYGMSPIMTVNNEQTGGGEKVSDLFNNLVVPNWTLSYNNRIVGGKYKEDESNDDSDEDDVIDDDLHEKLLELVKEHNAEMKRPKKKTTRRMKNKKGGTKRRKI